MQKMILPILFFVSISMVFGFQDAAAMTILFDDAPPGPLAFVCSQGTTDFCADDFVLGSSAIIQDAHFWVFDSDDINDNVYVWQILDDNNGAPGNLIASAVAVEAMAPMLDPSVCNATDGNINEDACYEIWIDIVPEVPLGSGTYWLAISESPDYDIIIAQRAGTIAIDFGQTGQWSTFNNFDLPLIITGTFVAVGGEFVTMSTSALLLAGAQGTMAWMIPVLVSGIGFAIVIARKF